MGSAQAGFSLVEVVVALAILALSLGALYESFGWSIRRSGSLRNQEIAWLTAQSMLAEIRARQTLVVGESMGEAPFGMQWSTMIESHAMPDIQETSLQAFDVTINVSWGKRVAQRASLQSVEIGGGSR